MVIDNVLIYTEQESFCPGMVVTGQGKIRDIVPKDAMDYEEKRNAYFTENPQCFLDGEGTYLIPGMIDIHLHGCKGYDFCDGSLEAVEKIAEYQASIGVTTIALATMTLPVEQLQEILKQGAIYCEKKTQGQYPTYADLAGINMEGPFISAKKCGAQNPEYIQSPDAELFRTFQAASQGLVKYMGMAPEEGAALEFITEVKDEVKVTLAHSDADYRQAIAAFEAGACHVTHLYNGMSAFSHREPGIAGAVYDSPEVEAELICDGIHVHPSVIRATFRLLGKERIILISDSIRATGMTPGEYELGGQKITVSEERAVISGTETIAGSVTTLPEGLRYAVKVAGIPLEDAVACVTKNPARSLGIYEECGSISVGKQADMVLLNKNLTVQQVVKKGNVLREER